MIERIEHDDVLEVRLARPPANALSDELIAALLAAVREAPEAGARAVVLSGRPGMFSAGLDVPSFLQLDRAGIARAWGDFFELMKALATSPVPTAAAMTGHAPAGGCVLSLFCDERVMAAGDFRIGLNEVQVGLPMPPVIFAALAHIVGTRRAERLCATAALIPSAEALEIGLVDELAQVEEVVDTAHARLAPMLALPPNAVRRTRAVARADLAAAFDDLDEVAFEHFVDDWFSPETQGSMQALVDRLEEKRRAAAGK
jgi:enoyl-CoA hydratase/carnithine racemase